MNDPFRAALERIPEGYCRGWYLRRRWGVQKTTHANGRSLKLFGRDLGGTDFISLNLYRLQGGRDLLKPCEMPEAKVRAFVLGFVAGRD